MLSSNKDLGKKPWAGGEEGSVHPAPEELWGSRGSLASNRGVRKGRNGYSHKQVRCRCQAKTRYNGIKLHLQQPLEPLYFSLKKGLTQSTEG